MDRCSASALVYCSRDCVRGRASGIVSCRARHIHYAPKTELLHVRHACKVVRLRSSRVKAKPLSVVVLNASAALQTKRPSPCTSRSSTPTCRFVGNYCSDFCAVVHTKKQSSLITVGCLVDVVMLSRDNSRRGGYLVSPWCVGARIRPKHLLLPVSAPVAYQALKEAFPYSA